MSLVEGSVLVVYQGARARRSVTSAGWCPVVAYQVMAMVWQARVKGNGAVDCGGQPVAGLPGAEELFGVFHRDLDAPPARP